MRMGKGGSAPPGSDEYLLQMLQMCPKSFLKYNFKNFTSDRVNMLEAGVSFTPHYAHSLWLFDSLWYALKTFDFFYFLIFSIFEIWICALLQGNFALCVLGVATCRTVIDWTVNVAPSETKPVLRVTHLIVGSTSPSIVFTHFDNLRI